MFSGNFFFSGWQVFLRRFKLCHFIIVLWLDSILLFLAIYIFLSAHFVTPIDLVERVSRYMGEGSWAVRDFSHASSWVSRRFCLSLRARCLRPKRDWHKACTCTRVFFLLTRLSCVRVSL